MFLVVDCERQQKHKHHLTAIQFLLQTSCSDLSLPSSLPFEPNCSFMTILQLPIKKGFVGIYMTSHKPLINMPTFFMTTSYSNLHSCAVHFDIIKVFYLPTDAQYSCFKKILKFTLKQLLHVSVQSPSSGCVLFELAEVIVISLVPNSAPHTHTPIQT